MRKRIQLVSGSVLYKSSKGLPGFVSCKSSYFKLFIAIYMHVTFKFNNSENSKLYMQQFAEWLPTELSPNLIIFTNRGNLCVKHDIQYTIGGTTFQRSRESPKVCTVSAATTCLGEYISRTPARSIHVIVN